MEELDESSMVLNGKLNVGAAADQTSDSGNSNYWLRASKRCRHEKNAATLARFKGVVPQQNGHWGAQIYANHHRIWLGTFKSEEEAAMAYDSAAIKLRSADSHRNFPWTHHNIQEPNFQNLYTTQDVLNMIRDGSYQAKLADFVNNNINYDLQSKILLGRSSGSGSVNQNQNLVHGDVQFSCMQLFQKELTPSDVGKLNRLVIPKKYAVKYFPYICENDEQNHDDDDDAMGGGSRQVEDMELIFYDKLMRAWKFRYCYWRSSQSFVFTRGWNGFVKEKKLSEKDVITFYTCHPCCPTAGELIRRDHFFLIDVNYNGESSCLNEEKALTSPHDHDLQVELELNLGNNFCCTSVDNIGETQFDHHGMPPTGLNSPHNGEERRITLFGVQIN